jgi:hypothetical protein
MKKLQFCNRTNMKMPPCRYSLLLVLFAGLSGAGCDDKSPEIGVALGTVQRVQFAFAGWNDHTQVEAGGRSISVQGIAPIPVSTSVELRGAKLNATQLCATAMERCWPIHSPQRHDWALLSLKPQVALSGRAVDARLVGPPVEGKTY